MILIQDFIQNIRSPYLWMKVLYGHNKRQKDLDLNPSNITTTLSDLAC